MKKPTISRSLNSAYKRKTKLLEDLDKLKEKLNEVETTITFEEGEYVKKLVAYYDLSLDEINDLLYREKSQQKSETEDKKEVHNLKKSNKIKMENIEEDNNNNEEYYEEGSEND